MVRRFSLKLTIPLALLVLLLVLYFARSVWLPWVAYALVNDESPCKADMAVVLAGDLAGHRLRRGAEILKGGLVPAVLVSGGPARFYGYGEVDLAMLWAREQGFPMDAIIPFPNGGHSTREEAFFVLKELQRRQVGSFDLVTSDYHTARARRIYLAVQRSLGLSLKMCTVGAPDVDFLPHSWWHNRESEKMLFMEWSKTVANVFGI